MNWNKFNTFGDSEKKAFEIFCNQIFKVYCEKTYKDKMKNFIVINGNGGDGGIEAYAELINGNIIAIQSKCFFDPIESSEISQIRKSIKTANNVRSNIEKYIVSVPRDLANKKKGVENYERKKIENLFKEFDNLNIEFEVWGESDLLDYIIKNQELAGVHKFWFENAEITFSTIREHFDIQKKGWLADRYNKNLHVRSKINHEIEKLLGEEQYNKSKIEDAKSIIKECKDYLLILKKYLEIENQKENLQKIYTEQYEQIKEITEYLLEIIEYLKNENKNIITRNKFFYLDTEWFYNLDRNPMSMHYSKMKESVEKIENIDINEFFEEFENDYSLKNLLIIGDFGTGKTHSVVNQIENEFERKNIPILIRASDIKSKSSWREIFIKTLGLSENWSEEEIFESLELLANRNNYVSSNSSITINKKILICVDGIDEHSDYEYWYEKQLETSELIKKYSSLRFCFIGRRYAFRKIETLKIYKVLNYDITPGYNVNEMFNKYMLEYNIKFGNSINIKTYLGNPLVLKIFAEEYRNKRIDSLDGLNINLVQLFKIKLSKMNEEFLVNNPDINCKDVLNRSAILVAEFLYTNRKIYKKDIINLMNDDDELALIDNSKKLKIIESLQKYGLLYVKTVEEDLGIKRDVYYKGMQPVIDYIIARKMSKHICNTEFDKINEKIKENLTILKLCALILFEENEKFLPDVEELDMDLYLLEESSYYAIVNSNPLKTLNIKNKVCKDLLKSPSNMRKILNNIIIPCSRVINHPLGAEMLNEILHQYKNMAERDKIWSLPNLLKENKLKITEDIIINNENSIYYLDENDRHNGLPLVYAWLLTGVDNMKLYFYRKQLMKWAILCPKEFILLLKKISKNNDIQMLEQMYGIAMCLCYKINNNSIVEELLNIVEENFFEDGKIKSYDFQIRSYIRNMAEKAFKLHIINKSQLKHYLPPYVCKKIINLDSRAAKEGNRMSGYSAIDYDLSRYVLYDHISYRFFDEHNNFCVEDDEVKLENVFSKKELLNYEEDFIENNEYKNALENFKKNKLKNDNLLKNLYKVSCDMEHNDEENINDLNAIINQESEIIKREDNFILNKMKFLEKEGKKIKNNNLSEVGFIISAAYQYLLECGWNENDFWKKGKVDCEIRGRYYPATHGAKSMVMSFVEKYIWCFRNEIMGYLADKFIMMNKKDSIKYYNYFEIDDVLDPITEYEQVNNGIAQLKEDFTPENVFEGLGNLNIEDKIKWLKSKDLNLKLKDWLYIKNEYLLLNRYDCFIDVQNDLEYTMWISSGIINKTDMKYLEDNIKNKQQNLYNIINNPDEFSEYTNSNGSRTPFEIINFDWNSVLESYFHNISLLDKSINRYKIYKTYESAYNVHTEFNEIHYKIPSQKIRKMLNINNNEEFAYKNGDEIVALYQKNNKSWDDHHNILVADAKKLNEKLKANNEILIWFIRIDKELNSLGREKYPEINDRNNIFCICWYEEQELKINFFEK